jgi:hypothetical protein
MGEEQLGGEQLGGSWLDEMMAAATPLRKQMPQGGDSACYLMLSAH